MSKHHILVVDDEARIRDVVDYALKRAGFDVTSTGLGRDAIARAALHAFDLIVLDIMLPDLDGFDVFRTLREQHILSSVLFLSAKSDDIDKIVGLEIGGDDYLTKPFSPRELVARVKTILRRTSSTLPATGCDVAEIISLGSLTIDRARHEVNVGDAVVNLTPLEFAVVSILCRKPGRVYSRAELIDLAYGTQTHVTDRSIVSLIRRLRKKFNEHGVSIIETVHGVGYKAIAP